jgi:Rnl2 family RNA ligase
MKFQRYPKIMNVSARNCDAADITGLAAKPWHVSEKMHGANMSWHIVGDNIACASRNQFVRGSAPFHSWLALLEEHRAALLAIADRVGDCIVCGEVFGGQYPGQPRESKTGPVQQGVWYSPRHRFAAFDLRVGNMFWSAAEAQALFDAVGLPTPWHTIMPTLTYALALPLPFVTYWPSREMVPCRLDNYAEGYVIKPLHARHQIDRDFKRLIFKRKFDAYAERDPDVKRAAVQGLTPEQQAVVDEVMSCITRARFDAVRSKHLPDTPARKLIGPMIQDILDDVPGVPDLDKVATRIMRKRLGREVAMQARTWGQS